MSVGIGINLKEYKIVFFERVPLVILNDISISTRLIHSMAHSIKFGVIFFPEYIRIIQVCKNALYI